MRLTSVTSIALTLFTVACIGAKLEPSTTGASGPASAAVYVPGSPVTVTTPDAAMSATFGDGTFDGATSITMGPLKMTSVPPEVQNPQGGSLVITKADDSAAPVTAGAPNVTYVFNLTVENALALTNLTLSFFLQTLADEGLAVPASEGVVGKTEDGTTTLTFVGPPAKQAFVGSTPGGVIPPGFAKAAVVAGVVQSAAASQAPASAPPAGPAPAPSPGDGDQAPAQPTDLRIVDASGGATHKAVVSKRALYFAWTMSGDVSGVTYAVRWYAAAACAGSPTAVTATGTEVAVAVDAAVDALSFDVTAKRGGKEAASACSAATTVDTTAPGAPGNVSVPFAQTNATDVAVSWTAPADGDLDHYLVAVGTAAGLSDVAQHSVPAGTLTKTVTLPTDGTYHLHVDAFDTAGNESPASGDVTVTLDRTPPGTPGTVCLRDPANAAACNGGTAGGDASSSASTARAIWTTATDGATYAVTYYANGSCTGVGTTLTGLTGTSTSFPVSASTTYSVTVTAYDAAGNAGPPSGCSNGLAVGTPTYSVELVYVETNTVKRSQLKNNALTVTGESIGTISGALYVPPRLIAEASGTLHVIYGDAANPPVLKYAKHSGSWSVSQVGQVLSNTYLGYRRFGFHQNGAGSLFISYSETDGGATNDFRAVDNTANASSFIGGAISTGVNIGLSSEIFESGGTLTAFAGQSTGLTTYTKTGIASWVGPSTVVASTANNIRVVRDANQKFHLVYVTGTAVRYGNNVGGSWIDELVGAISGAATGDYPGLYVDASGNAHVTFLSDGSTLKYARRSSGGTWVSETMIASTDLGGSGMTPYNTEVTVLPTGEVYALCSVTGGGGVGFYVIHGTYESIWTPITVESANTVGFAAIAFH